MYLVGHGCSKLRPIAIFPIEHPWFLDDVPRFGHDPEGGPQKISTWLGLRDIFDWKTWLLLPREGHVNASSNLSRSYLIPRKSDGHPLKCHSYQVKIWVLTLPASRMLQVLNRAKDLVLHHEGCEAQSVYQALNDAWSSMTCGIGLPKEPHEQGRTSDQLRFLFQNLTWLLICWRASNSFFVALPVSGGFHKWEYP